jgi:dTDP-4-amino-4,6-dideoxy-D-galactose acyltransferase
LASNKSPRRGEASWPPSNREQTGGREGGGGGGGGISAFKDEVVKENYIFTEIPSEDVYLMQALNESLFRLVETRMTYYLDLKNYNNKRYNVREAIIGDIPNLKKVSSKMVNPYDRFHADVFYNKKVADNFLGVFAEESVKGFADYVLVPDEDGLPSDSFLTARYNKEWWGEINIKVSKMVLSAVSSTTNKGWYIKLISEMALHLKELGVDFVMMHPASTNKAVIHSYEKLGCKLGKVTHILSYKKR